MKKAFTLIELLIVVAIIAILAAIAVPNFLEAQTRAKVTRTKADQRTMATALEAYKVDNNAGPSDAGNGTQGMWRAYANPPQSSAYPPVNYSIGFELTTPIAYLSSAAVLIDPFKTTDIEKYEANPATRGRQYYNFNNIGYRNRMNPQPYAPFPVYYPLFGEWVVMGAGPDRYVNNRPGEQVDQFSGVAAVRGHNYDPTNGTVSNGDVYRSQKYGVGMQERDSSIP